MKWTTISSFLAASLLAMPVSAAPILDVVFVGPSGGNLKWEVKVISDVALVPGSMSVELALGVHFSTIVSVEVNAPEWSFINPGRNPFTNTVTTGLWDDGSQFIFASYGSTEIFNDTTPHTLLTIETLGTGSTLLSYGDAATSGGNKGDLIAQGSLPFHDYGGTVFGVIPEPTTCLLGMLALAGVAVTNRQQ